MASGTKVDELIIQIKADTKQLKKELKQIEGKIRTTGAAGGAAFGSMAGGLSKVKGGAIAAVAGIAAMGVAISKVAQVGAGFEDLKDSLDQVFGSIEGGDAAMQKVFTFAQTTPFQIETATKAFIALKSAGIEPSMDMLQTFADTASVSVDELGTFEALIRMVQRSASGGMGLEELNMISDRGIDVLGILGDKLNLTKDDIAEYGKTAEGAAEMVKALTEGLSEKFGGAMESKMDNLSTKTSNMVIAFKQLGDELFKSGLGNFLKGMADRLTALANSMSKAIRASQGVSTLEDFGVDTGKTLEEQKSEGQAQADAIKKSADETFKQIGTLGDKNNTAYKSYEKQMDKYYQLQLQVFDLDRQIFAQQLEQGDKPVVFDAGNIDGLIDFQQTFKKLFDDTIPQSKKLGDQIEYIKNLMSTENDAELKGIMAFLGVKDVSEMQDVIDHLQKLSDELDTVATFSDQMRQAIINSSQAFTGQFVDALMDGQNALASFKDFARSMVSQIITIFLQLAVVNQILNNIFGLKGDNALQTIDPRAFFGGGNGVTSGGPVFDPMNMPRPKFDYGSAGGGTIQGGRATLVGERGPEIFVPNTGGTIMNNMNSKNAMGGGGTTVINQSINFATGIVPTVRAEVMQMMPQIADVTKAAVQESAMRGGTFRRSLAGG